MALSSTSTPFTSPCLQLFAAAALSALIGCTPSRLVPSPESSVTAIEHVTAIPMDTDRVLSDHTIIIREGVIESVVPSSGATIPNGALRINGRGRYAIPGIADMHVHLYDTDGFPSYLAYGITTILHMHGTPPVLAWRAGVLRGTLAGPTLYTASPSVNGYPPANPIFISIQDTVEARATARDLKTAGYDVIKVYSFLNPDVYNALLSEATRVGIGVTGHIPWQVGYARSIAAGQSNIAHIEEFFQDGDIPDDSMPAIARVVKASGATVTANLFAYADYIRTIANPQAVLDDPEMRYASPAQYSEKIPTSNRATNRSDLPGFSKFLSERRLRFQKLLRAFVQAGVPILVGTDTETFGFPGQSTHLELEQLVEAGLTPYQALQAGTRNAGEYVARNIRKTDKFGTLAPGMRADIVLLAENPLADIRAARSVTGTMARGRWYPRARLQQMRDSIAGVTAPQRRFVFSFDSLMMKAKNAGEAATLLRRFRTEYPSAIPLFELVWIGYGRMLYQQDKPNSIEIRKMAIEVYPGSFSARNQLGRGHMFNGDTTRALQSFRESLALEPHNFVVRDMIAKLEAARAPMSVDPTGVYTFPPLTMKIRGKPQQTTLVLTVKRAAEKYAATVKVGADSVVTADEVVAGGNQLWVTAPAAGADLELRLTISPTDARGTWVLGWSNNGELRGSRQK